MTRFMGTDNFLDWAKSENNKELIANEFDNLDLNLQESVIQRLEESSNRKLIEFLPYKKYMVIYDTVIKSDIPKHSNLVKGISTFHYEDASDLLVLIFQDANSEDSGQAAAGGLAKSRRGLSVLETALQGDNNSQQVRAAVGISQAANTNIASELLEVIKRYRTHENSQVRLECIAGLHKSQNLTSEYLRAALQDENDRVRRRTMQLIRNIDANIANDYVILLEDKKGYIVNEVLEILEKYPIKLDEEALADAITKELIIRESGRPSEYFNTEIIATAFQVLFRKNSRLYGETLKSLCDIAFNNKGAIRRRTVLVAILLDERGFLAQINENAENNPEAAKEILNLITGNLDTNIIASQISVTDPSDIQQNAANQIKLLAQYHESGLQQAKRALIGQLFFHLQVFLF